MATKSKCSGEGDRKSADHFQNALAQIGQRRWPSTSSYWLRYIPNEIFSPEPSAEPDDEHEPSSAVVDHPQFLEVVETLERPGGSASRDIPAVRTSMFQDATYQLLRAANIVGCVDALVSRGKPTWSVSNAYQASFFASRALMLLLGVAYFEVNSKSYLVDIWPGLGRLSGQGKELPWEPLVTVHRCGKRFNHEMHWNLFMHIERRLAKPPWPRSCTTVLRRLNAHSDFSRRRNFLHYRDGWLFPDLVDDHFPDRYGIVQNLSGTKKYDAGFDVSLSQMLLAMCVSAIRDISVKTRLLDPYLLKVAGSSAIERQPLLRGGELNEMFAFGEQR